MNEIAPNWSVPRRLGLRVEDFDVLIESGAFVGMSKVELIEGEMLLMSPQHVPHARIKTEIGYRLREALAGVSRYAVVIEATVTIPPDSAPEPDIVLTDAIDAKRGAPVASVPLVVEVSDTTLDYDFGRKAAIYARAGIPEYWIVSVQDRTILQLTAPGAGGYGERRDIPFDTPVTALTLPGLTIATTGL